jgi:hypothetical protein
MTVSMTKSAMDEDSEGGIMRINKKSLIFHSGTVY